MNRPCGCDCAETLSETLGGYLVEEKAGEYQQPDQPVPTCFWCGDQLVESELDD
jgi:hypothetical protein